MSSTACLARLQARMEATDLPELSDRQLESLTRDVYAGRRQLEGYLTRLAGEANRRQDHGDGAPAEDVMRGGGEASASEAAGLARRGRLKQQMPSTGSAAEAGHARSTNTDLVAKVLDGLSTEERQRLGARDAEISSRAGGLPPETFARWFRKLVRTIRDQRQDKESGAETEKAKSSLRMERRRDGRWWVHGDLDAERGAAIHAALKASAAGLAPEGESPTPATWAAALYQRVCGGGPGGGGGPVSLGIGYIIDVRTLFDGPHDESVAQTWAGDDHDPHAVHRLACDADWVGVVIDSIGQVTRVGRTHRAATAQQRLALRALYPACPLSGAPFDQCEIHHVTFYEQGGDTDLHNLVPISSIWHHRVHDRGWRLVMHADRSLDLHRPDGAHYRHIPPPRSNPPQRE